MTEFLAKLGLGAVLAWAALPLLYLAARSSKQTMPDAREKTLLLVFGCAAILFALPFVPLRSVPEPLFQLARPVLMEDDHVRPMPSTVFSPLAALGAVWAVATVLRALFRFVRWMRLQWKLDEAGELPERVANLRDLLCRELGIAPPEIVVSDAATLPFVTGAFEPRVFLPRAVVERLADAQLSMVLRHELVHVARNDGRTALLAELFALPFPAHPIAARISNQLIVAREQAVDLRASAADPHGYATLLVDVAEYHRHGVEIAGAVAMGKHALGQRISLLTLKNPTGRDGVPRLLLLALAVILSGAALATPRISQAADAVSFSDGSIIHMHKGEEKRLNLGPVKRIAIGDPSTADVKLLPNFELLLVGGSVGKTTLLVWENDGRRVSYLIDVR